MTDKRSACQSPSVRLIWFTVGTGFLLMTWHNVINPLSLPVQLAVLVASLLLTGIPHGALDHLVQKEQARRVKRSFYILGFLARYLIIMLVYAVAWYILPQLSLTLFLLTSAWHFAETDITNLSQTKVWSVILRLIYGIALLGWILFSHLAAVNPILLQLVNGQGLFYSCWLAVTAQAQWLLPVLGLIITGILVADKRQSPDCRQYWLLGQLLFILLCSYTLPLLLAFALYFAGWHSLNTLLNIKGFITHQSAVSNKPLFKLWLKALPFTLLAISGLVLAGYFFKHYMPVIHPLPLLFVFLSLITMPHTEVMHGLNKSLRA
ncbi:Brp/Blh family beta-carotene 15,15'-dioxygenase [Mucilaginibacter sp. CSA2-8R]|uniref:Brp/Blh family beta-carotene 15,15'-dioxygenase n=1 Tax=Mucilaginibacter sp. CSA2-8R TaxID=3141542 RepID=UPI00315CE608